MGQDLWLLTEAGILGRDGAAIEGVPIGSASVTAGDARDGRVAAVVEGRQVWVRERGRWRKAASADVRVNCVAWTTDGRLLAGTEAARLAWIADDGLRFLEAFDRVPERPTWDTPWGGPADVRSLAVSADGAIYADIHVGWIVGSRDGGSTWASLRAGLDKDVHMVAAHPTRGEVVFAATAEGPHFSADHGERFVARGEGMPYLYGRAVACFPDRDAYLASTARHDGGTGAMLFRSEDEGRAWTRVAGLPDRIHGNIDTHQVACLPDGRAHAVVRDTDLYESTDVGRTWRRVADGLPDIAALLVT